MLQLQGLPADAILAIIAFCDVCTVLLIAQTCKHLRTLALQKTVWLPLLDDLNRRHFFDPAVNLRDLSTYELLDLLKRLVTGPKTWAPDRDGCINPVVQKSITLHPSITTGPGIRDWENEAKLLPGGRYVLFGNWNTLECWDVQEDTLVWEHSPAIHSSVLQGFTAEVLDGGKSAVVALCEGAEIGVRHNNIEVIRVDLSTGDSTLLFAAHGTLREIHAFCGYPVLCGDIVAIPVRSAKDEFLIINWKTSSAFLLGSSKDRPFQLALLPYHAILNLNTTGLMEEELRVFSLVQFAPHWITLGESPVNLTATKQLQTVVPISRLSPLLTQRIIQTRDLLYPSYRSRSRLSVRADPLHRDTYRLWVYVERRYRSAPTAATIHGYRFSCATASGGIDWRELTANAHTVLLAQPHLWHPLGAITYSGYMQLLDEQGRQLIVAPAPASLTAGSEVQLVACGDYVDVAAYSGALTYPTFNSIVILYFK